MHQFCPSERATVAADGLVGVAIQSMGEESFLLTSCQPPSSSSSPQAVCWEWEYGVCAHFWLNYFSQSFFQGSLVFCFLKNILLCPMHPCVKGKSCQNSSEHPVSLPLVALGRPGGILPLQALIKDLALCAHGSVQPPVWDQKGVRSQRALLPQGFSSSKQEGCETSKGIGIQLEQEEVTCPGRVYLQCMLGSEHRLLVKHPAKLGWLPACFLMAGITPSTGTADARPSVSSSSPRNTHCDGLEQVTMAMCALPWRQHFIPLPVVQNESVC